MSLTEAMMSFKRLFLALSAAMLQIAAAQATMPSLTDKPRASTFDACQKWASTQNEDAMFMWGQLEDGRSLREVAIHRLALSCMGDPPPEIVGFSSSIGTRNAFCKSHAGAEICKRSAMESAHNGPSSDQMVSLIPQLIGATVSPDLASPGDIDPKSFAACLRKRRVSIAEVKTATERKSPSAAMKPCFDQFIGL